MHLSTGEYLERIAGILAPVLVTQVSAKLIWKLFSHIFEALEHTGIQGKKPTGKSSVVSNQLVGISLSLCRPWVLGVKRGFQLISPGQVLLADYRGRRAHTVSTSRTEAFSDPSNL